MGVFMQFVIKYRNCSGAWSGNVTYSYPSLTIVEALSIKHAKDIFYQSNCNISIIECYEHHPFTPIKHPALPGQVWTTRNGTKVILTKLVYSSYTDIMSAHTRVVGISLDDTNNELELDIFLGTYREVSLFGKDFLQESKEDLYKCEVDPICTKENLEHFKKMLIDNLVKSEQKLLELTNKNNKLNKKLIKERNSEMPSVKNITKLVEKVELLQKYITTEKAIYLKYNKALSVDDIQSIFYSDISYWKPYYLDYVNHNL